MPRRALAIAAAAGALVGALALTIVVTVHPAPLPGEIAFIRTLQDLGGPVPALADVVRATTGTEAALLVALVPAIWLVRRARRAGLLAVLIAVGTMLVVQPGMKELVDRPRPTADQVEVRAEHSSKSYPSGHSMSTTTVWGAAAALAWSQRRRGLAAAAAVPVVATFLASGVHGVHWPTDALGGTLLGGCAATAIVTVVGSTRAVDRR